MPVISSGTPEILNPSTPTAFLPPDVAYELTIATYVIVGSLAVLIWDILYNLKTDYLMLSRGPIRFPLIVFVISRLGTLASILSITITTTAPVGNCEHIWVLHCLYLVAIPPTLLLLFLRIRALYLKNRNIQAFFFCMWLAVTAADVTPLFGSPGGYIGNTNYCLDSRLKSYVSASCIVPLVNDVLVFIATGWKIVQMTYEEQTLKNRIRVVFFRNHLPVLSRSILKDGQLYLLTTIVLNFVTTVMFFSPNVPAVYQSFIGIPNIVIINTMACNVFRNIRLGVYRETTNDLAYSGSKEGPLDGTSGVLFKRPTNPSLGSDTATIADQDDNIIIIIRDTGNLTGEE